MESTLPWTPIATRSCSTPCRGNLLNAPKEKPWFGFNDLCTQYGDVVYLRVLGQHTVVLGTPSAIMEFLEKRTANTSDRQVTPLTRLTGNEWILGLIPYGQRWRSYRRTMWQYFHPGAIDKYRPVQRAVARTLLQKLLKNPANFKQHIRFAFSATILKIGYGIDVEDEDHEIIRAVDEAVAGAAEGFMPGKFLVDFIPLLQYVPVWCPGAGFQKTFARWRAAGSRLKDVTFRQRNTAFTENIMPHTKPIVDELLTRMSHEGGEISSDTEDLIKSVAAVIFEAGSDTTFATLQATFLAMALYPEVQQRAQKELDATIGPNRLPNVDDRDSLVYINAVVKESFRWHTVTPLSIAHRTIKDDEIHGYFIPGGTILVPNIWACMHDPQTYEEPDEFRPERFIRDGKLDPTVLDPFSIVFGSGRRICPGRYFADVSLFLNIACVLHVFDIGPPLDEHGKPILIVPRMTDGLLSHLEDCRCTITPRSANAEALIMGIA